ncbi:hypothetical protein AVI51_13145 [Piscirickettsia salmonis]|uniref:type II toxin-antitoxin system VapC family toxin n=1 Tax=Piscirickettsia salmonis TaxID=1238 RepID=UPI00094A1F0C|nr:hypothetical protein AVI50_13260 [Piscirickettsia salmonis]APS54917.1 hypothetical protein AVI51_13145 [Piscirickettsia salmonis]
MKYILDTHVLLWAAGNSSRLSVEAKFLLSEKDNELFFSAASLWEIAIKNRALLRKVIVSFRKVIFLC